MLILASNSPRRKEICELLDLKFTIIPSKSEAELDLSLSPEKAVEKVALLKAQEVFLRNQGDVVIGADTAVFVDGCFLGKPKGKNEAKEMLKRLSGKTHVVITGVAILAKGRQRCFSQAASVEFYELTEEEIDAYIATGEPMDKAGAYGIQGKGARLVKGINGDFYTVMGLPCGRLYRELAEFI